MLIKERIGKKSLFEIDPQKRYELGNIRDLNFLTVNYLQRKALINDIKMFEDVTEAIKEIKSYILEKSDFASELFPTIPSTQPIIPEFFADLKKSEFMSQICNENHSEIQKENNIVKQDPSRYFYFKLLMFSISVSGNYAPHILSVFHKDFNSNILIDLCDFLLGDEAACVDYKYKKIESDFHKKKISATDYGLYNNLLAGDVKKLLLNKIKLEDSKYKNLMDFDSKIKCFELIKEFSHKYGYYDAYSLTAYHDIEYYLDCFAKIMTTNKTNKHQYPISSIIYPKCFNMSDVLIYEENHRKKNNKFYKNELNIFTGRNINFKDACKRFIGILIWDVYNTKEKCTVTDAINKVENWLHKKYGMVCISKDENEKKESYLEATKKKEEMRGMKYGKLGIKMEESSMVKLYETAKACIEAGEYLVRDSSKGSYGRPILRKSDDLNESLQNEFWNKSMHLKHGNYIFSRSA